MYGIMECGKRLDTTNFPLATLTLVFTQVTSCSCSAALHCTNLHEGVHSSHHRMQGPPRTGHRNRPYLYNSLRWGHRCLEQQTQPLRQVERHHPSQHEGRQVQLPADPRTANRRAEVHSQVGVKATMMTGSLRSMTMQLSEC